MLHLLIALQASPGLKFAEPVRINPDRPACVTTRAFPVLQAHIEPADTIASARLFFRPESYALWYEVRMQRGRNGFVALLPKPRPSARRIVYYIDAEGAMHMRARSLEQAVRVVEDPAECTGKVAEAVETATITVGVPKGAPPVPPVPPGFEPVGAVGEDKPGNAARDSLITAGVVAGAAGAAALLRGSEPAPLTPEQQVSPELTVLDSVPPPESHLSLGQGAMLSVRVRLRLHQAIHAGEVQVMLFRNADGAQRPCGVVHAQHNGFAQGALQEVMVSGPLLEARPCDPSDRVRIIVTQLGQEFVSTGRPGIPDQVLRYFVSP